MILSPGDRVRVFAPHMRGEGEVLYGVPAGDRAPERYRIRLDGASRTTSVASKYLRAIERPHPSPGELSAVPDYDGGPELQPVSKDPPLRSERYKAWIRTQPCAYTGSRVGVEASHHVPKGGGRMGKKTSDYNCLPLCALVHRRYHETGAIGEMNAEQTEGWVLRQINEHLARYVDEVAA